jgi:hypothetical protein
MDLAKHKPSNAQDFTALLMTICHANWQHQANRLGVTKCGELEEGRGSISSYHWNEHEEGPLPGSKRAFSSWH